MSKLLKIFAMVFMLLPAAAFAQDVNDYTLGAGDLIRVQVFQNPDLTTDTRVSESGEISFPLLGTVKVGGNTIGQAERRIAQGLVSGGFVQKPQVNISLTQVRGNQVAVLGLVNRPGRFPLETFNTHLSEMLATAGGVVPQAGNGLVILTGTRQGQPIKQEIDLATLFLNDKKDQDLLLNNGDVLYVVPGNQVSVLGQVNRPGRYPLENYKMKLSAVLAQAGGVTETGADSAIIEGVRDGQAYRKEVDLTSIFINSQTSEDVDVVAGDSVYVHRAPLFYIYGEVQRPGSYRVEKDMTVMQALAQGGGPTARGTQSGIKLHRKNATGTVEKTNPQLSDAVNAGDVLYVRESLF